MAPSSSSQLDPSRVVELATPRVPNIHNGINAASNNLGLSSEAIHQLAPKPQKPEDGDCAPLIQFAESLQGSINQKSTTLDTYMYIKVLTCI